MKRFFSPVAMSLLFLLVAGCSPAAPTHQALFDQMMASMDEMGTILSGITDEASAIAAKPKMEALAKTLSSIRDQGKALGEPAAELKAQFEKKMAEKQAEMTAKMTTFAMNAAKDPKILQVIEPIMRDFGNAVAK